MRSLLTIDTLYDEVSATIAHPPLCVEGAMSDAKLEIPDDSIPVPFEIEVPSDDWWYFAAYIDVHMPHPEGEGYHPFYDKALPDLQDFQYETVNATGMASILNTGNMTLIAVQSHPDYVNQWKKVLADVQRFAANARKLRRDWVGQTFQEILDDYYAAKERGQRPKLRALAEARGANYASLRQAKIRYDKERKKNASDD
jgi:hypothetical protein